MTFLSKTYAKAMVFSCALFGVANFSYALDETVPPVLFDKMEYRFAGPYRGGRSVAVTGVTGNPQLYYMGTTGGGVWKTENAGVSWKPLSDKDFAVGTIGAVAVAPSDASILYVGTGEGPIRGVTTSHGKGVYKSTDGGENWSLVGLDTRGQIPKIRVHPTNPDIVWVAVQGNIWAPNEERGVFKTTDGGKTWQHVLKVNAETGAADLVIDPSNPRILYAAMWNHGRKPWYVKSGGEGSGIYKSTDAGNTWEKLSKGLPETVGKIGIDVSAANPKRLYAIVEAEDGGLFRSDNGGNSWTLLNGDTILRARSWYYNHIKADPNDENTVYVMNVNLFKSIDGGKNFTSRPLPHGDTHDLWINPDNSNNMVNANDGGATITFDGGESWSSIYNQPTAQFYRVVTDNLSPYNIYGGQQDNTTLASPSRTRDSGIGYEDQFSVGGGESAHISFDENNPKYVYATTINATLTEFDRDTGRTRPIMPYPEYVFGRDAKDQKYRTNWNAPVLVSQHKPNIVYYGTQKLLKTADRGINWQEISPDLTRNDLSKQGLNGGPITNEQAGAEYYNTLFYLAESPHEFGEIWVGADDGTLSITRDEGKSWSNITPHKKGEAQVNAIEISPHQPGKAYIAVTGYKLNDFKPYIYVTKNYGKRWKRIDKGLPEEAFVRVVREDSEREGLLFAGTESGMFVSFDDGSHWQSLKLNLPPVPITDIKVKDNDVVIATQGRGFYILDNIEPIRDANSQFINKSLHVYSPVDGSRAQRGGMGSDIPQAKNPPRGVLFRYYLNEDLALDEALIIDIKNSDGKVVRQISSSASEFEACAIGNQDARSPVRFSHPSTKKGYNQWQWNMRRAPLNCINNVRLFGGWEGARVMPGDYSATLRVGDYSETTNFKVLADPREEADQALLADVDKHIEATAALFNEMMSHLQKARNVRKRLTELKAMDTTLSESNQGTIDSILNEISLWEALIIQPKHTTFEDDINWPNMLDRQVQFLMGNFDQTGAPVQAGAVQRLNDLDTQWKGYQIQLEALFKDKIDPLNQSLTNNGLRHLDTL
ncbi:glycosyl hydrolase [Alteromonas sp. 5E99-2]|uniref:WD40/YVTN/BNR-like repeat-containing protein n=1 Tax=Alteromonas sp. 5E99-2 TaxID=2817683 RepID=UPI001A984A37|nr:glycosyl hydrolase [Alteromonas sp. 5E99-2]MBO1256295.1 glycosyl hydrolase [Alteromonas sp. 5E99-2]